MSNNRKRSAAVREHMAKNPGVSFTAAAFAVKDQHAAPPAPTAPAKPVRPDVSHLYGHLVVAKAPRRRTRAGLLLPPAPGTRSTLPRLQPEAEGGATRFDPTGWEITPTYGAYALANTYRGKPVYRFAELPPKALLATETTLRTEMRKAPRNAEADVLAWYYVTTRGRRGHFALYATADAQAMPELSDKRQATWDAARTCATCGKYNATPYPNQTASTVRYCPDCWKSERRDAWIAGQRPLQLEQTEWAKAVIADPGVILVGVERHTTSFNGLRHAVVVRIRVESFAGELLEDVRSLVKPSYAAALPYDPDLDNPDERALLATITPVAEVDAAFKRLVGRRRVDWWPGSRSYPDDQDGRDRLPAAEEDNTSPRFKCWAARLSPHASGPSNRPAKLIRHDGAPYGDPEPFTWHEWSKRDAVGRIEFLRECINTLATEPPGPTYEMN